MNLTAWNGSKLILEAKDVFVIGPHSEGGSVIMYGKDSKCHVHESTNDVLKLMENDRKNIRIT